MPKKADEHSPDFDHVRALQATFRVGDYSGIPANSR